MSELNEELSEIAFQLRRIADNLEKSSLIKSELNECVKVNTKCLIQDLSAPDKKSELKERGNDNR